jgi:hypothetical protein
MTAATVRWQIPQRLVVAPSSVKSIAVTITAVEYIGAGLRRPGALVTLRSR